MAKNISKKLVILLSLGAILFQTGCGSKKTAFFDSRDAAGKACLEHLENEIKSEIFETSDPNKGYENWTNIKNENAEYLIFSYTCKPNFTKGDTVGELMPIYFYLDKYGEIEWKWLKFDKEKMTEYTYPLGERVDFDSGGLPTEKSKMSWFVEPFNMPFTSIKSDAFVTGVGFGYVMRLCRSTYRERVITEEQAEILFQKDREYITKMIGNEEGHTPPMGPTSEKAKDLILSVMDGRWEKCKEENYMGWNEKM